MKTTRSSLAALLGGVGLVASAAAPCAPFSVSTDAANSPDTQTLSFLQFDSALGTLTGVVFTLTSQTTQNASVQGNFSGGEGGTASATMNALFTIDAGGLALFAENGSAFAQCQDFSGGFPDCSSGTDGQTPPTFPGTQTVTNPPEDLSAFIGNGSSFFDAFVELDVSTLLQTCSDNVAGQGQCTFDGAATWSGTLEVEYRFTPAGTVPEPASLALVGLGLAGLAFSRRKR